jgi:hypothetical protein
MFDWLARNKEWVFSGIGITVGALVVWLIGVIARWFRRQSPTITISFGLTDVGLGQPLDLLCVTIKNPTNKTLYLGNVLLVLKTRRTLFVTADAVTGQPQQKRALAPGDSLTFHYSKQQLLGHGVPAPQYAYAFVENVAGVAVETRISQIARLRRAIVLAGNDVIDFKGDAG